MQETFERFLAHTTAIVQALPLRGTAITMENQLI